MAISRAFAYNTGSHIEGTMQVGYLAVVTGSVHYSGSGVKWYNGPDEEDRYIVARVLNAPRLAHPYTDTGSFDETMFAFWATPTGSTAEQFLGLVNYIRRYSGEDEPIESGSGADIEARDWLFDNGMWTNFTGSEEE
jgi:hypothetical protein